MTVFIRILLGEDELSFDTWRTSENEINNIIYFYYNLLLLKKHKYNKLI